MIILEPSAFEIVNNIVWKAGMKSLLCVVCLF